MSDIFELPNTNDATLEEILDNTDNKRIFLSSDWHIMKYKYTKEHNPVTFFIDSTICSIVYAGS